MRLLFFFICISCLGHPVLSQPLSDSLFVSRVAQTIINQYPDLINRDAPIYNGRVHLPNGQLSDNGHAFFQTSQYVPGTIVYEGYTYDKVKLQYDLVLDQLVLLHFDETTSITVVPEHVNSFSLHGHNYIHLKTNNLEKGDADIKPGYYDLLHDGKIDLLAKRIKSISEKITQTRVERTVSQQDRYYLLKNSVYTPIKNKKALLKLLQSTHSQNQQFIKTSQLNFKRDKENAILKLVQFHDSIAL